MFRKETTLHKGRLCQFTQFGVEHIGDSSPYSDVQNIEMACECLKAIGISHKLKVRKAPEMFIARLT